MYIGIIFSVTLQCILVKCLIPDLMVQKLDRKVIEKKRQDTREMCKIFNAETERMKYYSRPAIVSSVKRNRKRRLKRDVDSNTIAEPKKPDSHLSLDEKKHVESVVDKMYDELEKKGEKVKYRRRDLPPAVDKKPPSKSRRYDFAPVDLLGPYNATEDPQKLRGSKGIPVIPWPKKWKHGIVPYFIDPKTYDSHLSDLIIRAFDYFERATCIRLQRLRERPVDQKSLMSVEWLYITNAAGLRQCVHSNERKQNQGVQMVIFGYDCMSMGEILHEVMHILGYSHEHTRPDRDQYVTILWDNIKPGYRKYFEIRKEDPLMSLPYDYASILHYPPRAFSKNGQVTVYAEPGSRLGQREGLSEIDIEKIGLIYGNECVDRNREYLLTTCPSVIKNQIPHKSVPFKEIKFYFESRLWPFGIVNYKLRDEKEFTPEERENIATVLKHITKETCIEFKNAGENDEAEDEDVKDNNNVKEDKPKQDSELEVPKTTPKLETGKDPANASIISEPALSDYKTEDDRPFDILKASNDRYKVKNKVLDEGTDDNDDSQRRQNRVRRSATTVNTTKVVLTTTTVTPRTTPTKNATRRRRTNSSKKASRRHAANLLILTRTTAPGCQCPPPGRPDGNQILEISADCFNSANDLLHLFVHVLGLDHQHNMHDRDSYLHIVWDKLNKEVAAEMKDKLPPEASVGFSYDYQSVMHYPWLQIKNGVTNIMYPIWNDGWAMGHWQGLSSTDVLKLNTLYSEQCAERARQESKASKYY